MLEYEKNARKHQNIVFCLSWKLPFWFDTDTLFSRRCAERLDSTYICCTTRPHRGLRALVLQWRECEPSKQGTDVGPGSGKDVHASGVALWEALMPDLLRELLMLMGWGFNGCSSLGGEDSCSVIEFWSQWTTTLSIAHGLFGDMCLCGISPCN